MATILRPSLDRWVRGQQGQRYRDDFASLSGRWVAQAGSLAVSGGALQAATLGDWLPPLSITNAEFTSDVSGWSGLSANIAWRDSASTPGDVSPGDDAGVIELERTGNSPRAIQTVSDVIKGIYVRFGLFMYAPSGNTEERDAGWELQSPGATALAGSYNRNQISAEDTWETVSKQTDVPTGGTSIIVRLNMMYSGTNGDVSYYDKPVLYRINAPALLAGWRSPNHVAMLRHVSPAVAGDATDYVPFGYICRYTDSLNYWEVRVLPNTAGNDLQIIQVTAGVETTRAEADVDWTSDDTDELRVRCAGATISTEYRKSGASGWTAGPSYASATQGQTSPQLGVMLYEAGVGRLSGFDVRRA